MNKLRNTERTGPAGTAGRIAGGGGSGGGGAGGGADDGRQRLSARSLVLSALLGGHPPQLPTAAVLALGELFTIPDGTMRTAMSRMVAAGEIEATDGAVRLSGRLLDRQARQDLGRHPAGRPWDGRWWTVVAAADRRPMAERRAFRAEMTARRFAELRPDTWLRPANLPESGWPPGVLATTGELHADDLDRLVRRLWPLDELATSARRLRDELSQLGPALADGPDAVIPDAFTLSADVVRFLTHEPLLPASLVPDPWPADALRSAYDRFEALFQTRLRRYLTARR